MTESRQHDAHDLHDDDLPVGRLLTRREVVRLLAVTGAAALVGCERGAGDAGGAADAAVTTAAGGAAGTSATAAGALPRCLVRPQLTVGPYFLDEQLDRSDIRAEPTTGAVKEGAPLALTFNVSAVSDGRCRPIQGAMVDVWQCDAAGLYSGVTDQTVGFDTVGQKFLRGHQVTDAAGAARFTTIYPGWYPGRTVHIHFKVRAPAAAQGGGEGAAYEFTSQLFFDEALTDRVFARAPYAAKGKRDTTNASDRIYGEGGSQLLLAVADEGPGYRATFDVGLDLSDAETGRPDRSGGPRGRRPPRGGAPPAA